MTTYAEDEVFDLDATRAANPREPFRFTFGGKQYWIDLPISFKALWAIRDGDVVALVPALFGDQADELIEAGLTADHVSRLVEEMFQASEPAKPSGAKKSPAKKAPRKKVAK